MWDSKTSFSVSSSFSPASTNDSGFSESSLGMMIKAKLSQTFMQNVICKPAAMSSVFIFFSPCSPFLSIFYPSTIHSVKSEDRGSLGKKNDLGVQSYACLHLESISDVSGHVTKIKGAALDWTDLTYEERNSNVCHENPCTNCISS